MSVIITQIMKEARYKVWNLEFEIASITECLSEFSGQLKVFATLRLLIGKGDLYKLHVVHDWCCRCSSFVIFIGMLI